VTTQTTGGGAEGAAAAVDFLKQLMQVGVGVQYVSAPRNDGISNAEIIRIHAEEGVNRKDVGNVKRSLYPNESQINALTKVFTDEVTKHLLRIGQEYTRRIKPAAGASGPAQQVTMVRTEEKQVKQAGASALKKVAVIYHDHMEENLTAQKNTDGTPMRSVKDDYAIRRLREHSVDPSAVFQATGQLENAFEAGKYILYYDPSKINNIKKGFGLDL
jgi:hypothetical protein